nr:hypothetical protein RSP673_01130 [Ralstonia solanacearum P673]
MARERKRITRVVGDTIPLFCADRVPARSFARFDHGVHMILWGMRVRGRRFDVLNRKVRCARLTCSG